MVKGWNAVKAAQCNYYSLMKILIVLIGNWTVKYALTLHNKPSPKVYNE